MAQLVFLPADVDPDQDSISLPMDETMVKLRKLLPKGHVGTEVINEVDAMFEEIGKLFEVWMDWYRRKMSVPDNTPDWEYIAAGVAETIEDWVRGIRDGEEIVEEAISIRSWLPEPEPPKVTPARRGAKHDYDPEEPPSEEDYRRASGLTACDRCAMEYRKHPVEAFPGSTGDLADNPLYLHRLCNGSLVKL